MAKYLRLTTLLILFSSKAISQNNEQLQMVKAVSYYYGMESSLDCIIKNYTDLKGEAMSNKMNVTIAHKSSVDSMKKVLYSISKEKYKELESLTKQFINCDIISHQISKDYLKNFTNEKIKGNHETYNEFVQILLKYNPKYKNNSIREFSDNYRTKFTTDGHQKSKGLNFSIEIPLSWDINEGSRPNIICKAINQRDNRMALLVMTKEYMSKQEFEEMLRNEPDLTSNELNEILRKSVFTEAFMEELNSYNIGNKNIIKTKIDGQPAIMMNTITKNERVGNKIRVEQDMAMILYRNYLITITLGVSTNESVLSNQSVVNEEKVDLLFKSILNSLVISDKWK